MIHIKCKNCGWRLPFSSKGNEDSVGNRGDGNIICSSCGEILIKEAERLIDGNKHLLIFRNLIILQQNQRIIEMKMGEERGGRKGRIIPKILFPHYN